MSEEKDFFKTCFNTVASLDVKNESQAIAKEVVLSEVERLQQENKQLKEKLDYDLQWAFKYDKQVVNWNKLKKWLEKELGDRINPNKDKWLTGVYDAYRETIDKMKELEGSDNNE